MTGFLKALKAMIGSKKAIATVAGLLAAVAARYGLDLASEDIIAVLSPILAYIVGQGMADIGKEVNADD